MKETLGRLWKFANTDVSKLVTLDNVKSTADSGKAVFALAKALEENKSNAEIGKYVSKISTLLDALNSPWGQLIGAGLPFVSIGVNLLKFYLDITGEEPPLMETVVLITQSAYLNSLNNYLKTNRQLAEQLTNSDHKFSEQVANEISSLINKFAKLEIDDKDACFALAFFADSKLAKDFNLILHERLFHSNIEPSQIDDITKQIASDTDRFITNALIAGS